MIVDTGLHYTGMTRAEALEYFKKYAWDSTDLSDKVGLILINLKKVNICNIKMFLLFFPWARAEGL